MARTLIACPDQAKTNELKELLSLADHDYVFCANGKDCQLAVYKGGVDCLVLDMSIDHHPALMVLKFMRLSHPSIKVVLIFNSKKEMTNLGLKQEDLVRLGASSVLTRPLKKEVVVKCINGEKFDSWKSIKPNEDEAIGEKLTIARDEEFTRLKIDACMSGNIAIFDHYIRLGQGRYVLIMRKGDPFDYKRIEKYIDEKKIDFLYFKTKDRTSYINFINELINKKINSSKITTEQLVKSTKSVTEKFIEEIYTGGIKPELIDEGKRICENMYTLVQRDSKLATYMREFADFDPSGYSHSFLVSFFSTIICKNLNWASKRTVEAISLGALFHDIGKLKLPPGLRELEEYQVPESQRALFNQHPLLGVQMLDKCPIMSDVIKQIVLQHHEYVNGEGFPYGLNSAKIYPLAKVVSLADCLSYIVTSKKITPLNALRLLIPDKNLVSRYDPVIVKALVMGMVK